MPLNATAPPRPSRQPVDRAKQTLCQFVSTKSGEEPCLASYILKFPQATRNVPPPSTKRLSAGRSKNGPAQPSIGSQPPPRFWDILLPSMPLGGMVGIATQKFGEPASDRPGT